MIFLHLRLELNFPIRLHSFHSALSSSCCEGEVSSGVSLFILPDEAFCESFLRFGSPPCPPLFYPQVLKLPVEEADRLEWWRSPLFQCHSRKASFPHWRRGGERYDGDDDPPRSFFPSPFLVPPPPKRRRRKRRKVKLLSVSSSAHLRFPNSA